MLWTYDEWLWKRYSIDKSSLSKDDNDAYYSDYLEYLGSRSTDE